MRSRLPFALVLAVMVAVGGCRPFRGSQAGQVAELRGGAAVQVRNQNFADMDVYVIAEGLATRLGTVSGNSTGAFVLDRAFFPAAPDLRLVATPIGGNGRASSGHILVSPGQTIEFTIAPLLQASSVVVR